MELLVIFTDVILALWKKVLILRGYRPKQLAVKCHDICNLFSNRLEKKRKQMKQNSNTWISLENINVFIALILNFFILSKSKVDKYIRIIWGPVQGVFKFKTEELGCHKGNKNLYFLVNALLLANIPRKWVTHELHGTLFPKETQELCTRTRCTCGAPSTKLGNKVLLKTLKAQEREEQIRNWCWGKKNNVLHKKQNFHDCHESLRRKKSEL